MRVLFILRMYFYLKRKKKSNEFARRSVIFKWNRQFFTAKYGLNFKYKCSKALNLSCFYTYKGKGFLGREISHIYEIFTNYGDRCVGVNQPWDTVSRRERSTGRARSRFDKEQPARILCGTWLETY